MAEAVARRRRPAPRGFSATSGGATSLRALALLALLPLAAGCSVKRIAVRTVADAMASGADVYATDDDPELVGAALPFGLKTIEGLLASDPKNPQLLLAAARGFTQYSYAFVELPADRLESEDLVRAEAERGRALRLFLRARDYALRGLEVTHAGIGERLRRDPSGASAELKHEDLPLAYWTAASWGAAIGLGKDHPDIVADLGVVRPLLERCLQLDEGWQGGALHAAAMQLEAATPPAAGGSPERAKEHFARAETLAGGHDAGLYVSYATGIAVPAQDRKIFDSMLDKALAVDRDAAPDRRLANALAQEQARWLQSHADDLFVGDSTE